jgi:hypothetical protein
MALLDFKNRLMISFLTFCLLSVVNYCNGDVSWTNELPEPTQQNDRILVAVVSATLGRVGLHKQLIKYLEFCERGYEIHIVLMTYDDFNVFKPVPAFDSNTSLFCFRTQMHIPVAFLKTPRDGKLTARYRVLFQNFSNKYDMFFSQEDDYLVEYRHVLYITKWLLHFRGTTFYPGFIAFEVPPNNPSLRAHSYHPVVFPWQGFHSFQLQSLNGTVLASMRRPWSAFFFLTSEMLSEVSKNPSWKRDIDEEFHEINAHFQHFWLTEYFRIVIPVCEFHESLIHHSSNRYSAMHFASLNTNAEDHNDVPSASEFFSVLLSCTSCPGLINRFPASVSFHSTEKMSCSQCLGHGQLAKLHPTYTGPFPDPPTFNSSIKLYYACENSTIAQFGRKENAPRSPGVPFEH